MLGYFGTDGIRGVPFRFPLTERMIEKIGFACAKVLCDSKKTVFVARDTRESGKKIIFHLVKGLNSAGMKVYNLGIITTPALSYLLSVKKPSFGIMVSASHNPPHYNGIKVFDSKGNKIDLNKENAIESIVDSNIELSQVNVLSCRLNLIDDYIDYVVSSFRAIKNDVVPIIDCSNGSAFKIAPEIFKRLGFRYMLIGSKPNGKNINVGCGALDNSLVKRYLKGKKYWGGISYDGDADRCIVTDEKGRIIDGDDIIMLAATYYFRKKTKNRVVVLTKMSNYGLVKYLSDMNIKVVIVDVGDKNVVKAMKENGALLGGESSGHIIFSNYLWTGDGIITSLEFLRICGKLGITPSTVRKMWQRYSSVLKSYKVLNKYPLENLQDLDSFIQKEQKNIEGRIVLRYSGTEPLLRILVEGKKDKKYLLKLSDKIYDVYKNAVSAI
ncbi:MAG: hypothetical protein ACP5IO_05975 [Elusimicrobiales bacterium]